MKIALTHTGKASLKAFSLQLLVIVMTIIAYYLMDKYLIQSIFTPIGVSLLFTYFTLFNYYIYQCNILTIKFDEELESNVTHEYIKRTILDIDKTIYRYNIIGLIALMVTIAAMSILSYFVFDLFTKAINQTKDLEPLYQNAATITLTMILIILRTSLLATVIITFLIHSFKFTNSSFDQATRFNKRKHATLFLLQVVSDFQKLSDTNIEKIMIAFKEWNVNVESAYTDNDFNSKIAIKTLERLDKSDENNNNLMNAFITLINSKKP